MIHSFELENFKAFGKRTKIPMGRRITLLFGRNSVGKTSIMQALALLSDALESNAADGRLDTSFGNTGVDLGGFEEFVYDHDVQRQVCIRVNVPIDATKFDGYLGKLRTRGEPTPPIESGAVEWRFRHDMSTGGGRLAEVHVLLNGAPQPDVLFRLITLGASAQPQVDALYSHDYRDTRRPSGRVIQGYSGASALAVCRSSMLEQRFPDYARLDATGIAEEFRAAHAREMEYLATDTGGSEKSDSAMETTTDYRTLDGAGLYSANFPIDAFCTRLARDEGMRVCDMDGIVLADPGFLLHHVGDSVDSLSYLDGEINCSAAVREEEWHATFAPFLTSANLAREIQLQIQETLVSLHWIGEARSAPKRVYNIGGSIPGSVGPSGEDIAGYLRHNPQVVTDTNTWLAALNIQYSLEVQTLEPSAYGMVALRLHDTSRDPSVDAAFSDVGYGISQVLPLIVQGVGQRDGVIVIQQPEVHIHPRLQADLGDFFIKESETKQFLIETHSEHLVLRLLRHVREPGEASIDPDDLVILYVDSGPDGPSVKRIRVDEDGDFMDEWPGGFFPERLDEVL
jgi:hypothetical protein